MTTPAAFLVVLSQHAHPDTIEATMDAVRQFRGVAGVVTQYDDVGKEIAAVRAIREETRESVVERARLAGGA